MKPAIAVLLVLATATCPRGVVAAPSIDFWSDEGDFALCHLDIPSGESRTWRIVAHPNGLTGLDSAEFRVTGWPAGYVHVVTPNPAATISLGDPLQAGCNIAFGTCLTGATVVLYSIETFNTGGGGATLSIEQHTTPSNSSFPCALVADTSCSPPGTTFACASTANAYVNQGSATPPADPVPNDAATDVVANAQLSWSAGHPGNECAVGVPSHRVHFGTSNDPPFVGEVDPLDNTVFDPGALLPNTTYHWRIEAIDTGFGISGPLWSFTTAGPLAVESARWNQVKRLYR